MMRWLRTAGSVICAYVPQLKEEHYIWRRYQVSQQQAERQKKSLLQTCMMFHHRAARLAQETPKPCIKNHPPNIGVWVGERDISIK